MESRAERAEEPVLHRSAQRECGAPREVRVVCGIVAIEREQVLRELLDTRERRDVYERVRRRSGALVVLGSCDTIDVFECNSIVYNILLRFTSHWIVQQRMYSTEFCKNTVI